VKFGEVQRGTISGITLQPLTTRLAEQLGAPNTHGMVVVSMQQRSDAYAAGLRPGDVIVSFNGTTIEDQSQLYRLLSDAKIGTTVTLGVLREGRSMSVKVPIVKSTGQARRR
jgi:serine protease Do